MASSLIPETLSVEILANADGIHANANTLDRIEQRLIDLQRVVDGLSKEMSLLKTKLPSRTRRNTNE